MNIKAHAFLLGYMSKEAEEAPYGRSSAGIPWGTTPIVDWETAKSTLSPEEYAEAEKVWLNNEKQRIADILREAKDKADYDRLVTERENQLDELADQAVLSKYPDFPVKPYADEEKFIRSALYKQASPLPLKKQSTPLRMKRVNTGRGFLEAGNEQNNIVNTSGTRGRLTPAPKYKPGAKFQELMRKQKAKQKAPAQKPMNKQGADKKYYMSAKDALLRRNSRTMAEIEQLKKEGYFDELQKEEARLRKEEGDQSTTWDENLASLAGAGGGLAGGLGLAKSLEADTPQSLLMSGTGSLAGGILAYALLRKIKGKKALRGDPILAAGMIG
jgi:hypothetical protein